MSKITIQIPQERSGCYCLKLKGQIVYVGMSGNVLSRFGGHSRKLFDSVDIFWCDKKEAAEWERKLIKEHRPKHNISLLPPAVKSSKFAKHYKRFPKVNFRDKVKSGGRLKRLRLRCGVPLKCLEEVSGVSQWTIRKMEAGKFSYIHTWEKVERGFKRIADQVSARAKLNPPLVEEVTR